MRNSLTANIFIALALVTFGTLAARAEIEKAPSINTPPAVSKAALEKVRTDGHGQYAYPDGFKSDFIETKGVRLHYVSGGSGSPVVFVHGFGSTWKMWEPALTAFAAKRRVIAIDLPGLGQSEPSKTGYSAEATSEILLGAIKALTAEPVVYVCHDLCISASYPLVAKNQDLIRKVVLMDSPIPDKAMWTYPGIGPKGPGLGWHFGFFEFGDIAEKLIATDPKLFMAYFINDYAGKKETFTDALLDELIEPYSRISNLRAAFSGYYSAHSDSIRQNEALLAQGRQIRVPSMAISGEKGVNDVLPKQMAARFVVDRDAFKPVILPGCGHWLLEECAPQVIAELMNFIDN